jgi:Na+-transporting NADH:ubiquinone oxidoreductase subunit C
MSSAMSGNLKSIIFAIVLCLVCSVLLTAASTGLKSYQQRNMAVDRHKNILLALGIITDDQPAGSGRIEALYRDYVENLWVDHQGRIVPPEQHAAGNLPLYTYVKDHTVQSYAVPVDTRGLWGAIHGYLAIENDGVTIRGFTVYQHSETPGLGGEIESHWFRKNFQGKKITDQQGEFVSIRIAKGKVAEVIPNPRQQNYVDGISGATMTGKFLSAGLKEILQGYEPVAINFRHHENRYLRVE